MGVGASSSGIARLAARFQPGRPAVICYVPLGDPIARGDGASGDMAHLGRVAGPKGVADPIDAAPSIEAAAFALLDTYAGAGVDVLEVGIPTTDPWLDGAEVRDSMARALDAGWGAFASARVLAAWHADRVRRGAEVPAILWFSYPDLPLDALRDGAAAGAVDALLMLAEHRHAVGAALPAELARLGVARCAFLPWEPEASDLATIAEATGYVMVQARPGVTGTDGPAADPAPLVRMARAGAPGQPVVTGFGISGPDDVRRVLASSVDGVISGSACVRALRLGGLEGLRAHLVRLVEAATGLATAATGPATGGAA